MKKTLRCKACGYVISENKIKTVCPACGLPKTVFEEFQERISPSRKFILELNLHPISVHFPQAFAILLLPLLVASILFEESVGGEFLITAKWLGFFLPFSVLASIGVGLFDAQIRFRKLKTPLLVWKIFLGSVLLGLSGALAWIIYSRGLNNHTFLVVGFLALACIGCQAMLGKIGGKLMLARLNG